MPHTARNDCMFGIMSTWSPTVVSKNNLGYNQLENLVDKPTEAQRQSRCSQLINRSLQRPRRSLP